MKFRVQGYSKDNGARVHMELEASSKAEAERKAIRSNLEVVRVDLTSSIDPHLATMPNRPPNMSSLDSAGASHAREQSRRGSSGMFKFSLLVLLLATLAFAAYYYWPVLQKFIPGMQK